MRTNIELDDTLIEQAMKLEPGFKTKKEVVNRALWEFVQNHKRGGVARLFDRPELIDPAYDHKAARAAD